MANIVRKFMFAGYRKLLSFSRFYLSLLKIFKSELICLTKGIKSGIFYILTAFFTRCYYYMYNSSTHRRSNNAKILENVYSSHYPYSMNIIKYSVNHFL